MSTKTSQSTSSPLSRAVDRGKGVSRDTILDWMFAKAFDGLVYPQIWEDPVVDMQAMDIQPGHHIVALASGGCNLMSYLTKEPGQVTAVDLNVAHLSLVELKKTAAQTLTTQAEFAAMFAPTQKGKAVQIYDDKLRERLPDFARRYWDSRSILGQRRISIFRQNPYKHGLLGRCIAIAHIAARLHGVKLKQFMQSKTIGEQRSFFEAEISPLYDSRIIRWITSSPVSLYGLGIPPAQYVELAEGRHMADVLRERTEKLACDYALSENYFARQAFGRSYASIAPHASLPPYLEAEHWDAVKANAKAVQTINMPVTEHLLRQPNQSVDRFVFLDAQDWMDDSKLNSLWTEVTRTARPAARVIFRTAGKKSVIEGRIDTALRARWTYHEAQSASLHKQDRSAIYGGFHLYELK